MPDLGCRLEDLTTRRERPLPVVEPIDLDRRRELYRSALTHRCPRFFKPGARMHFDVTVRSQSPRSWEPIRQSGIAAGFDSCNLDGHVRAIAAGSAEITAPIPAGTSAKLRMDMNNLAKSLPQRARFFRSDEGICRFPNGPRDRQCFLIWPFGRTAAPICDQSFDRNRTSMVRWTASVAAKDGRRAQRKQRCRSGVS